MFHLFHMEHLDIVLSKLSEAGLTLNLSKCKFAQPEVKFLGVKVGGGRVTPDPAKVAAIREFPLPETKQKMRSYLGFLSFYRCFIPNLATFIKPLTDLLKKSQPDTIVWSSELRSAFEKSKNLIGDEVLLMVPKPGYPFVVQSDASNVGLGALLGQMVDGKLIPITYISRVLNQAERNYAVIEKECLAIKWAISYFHEYLYGGTFVVKTDHAPLSWLYKNKDKNSRLMRWALSLQPYDFHIEYIKGSDNFLADMFSRSQ